MTDSGFVDIDEGRIEIRRIAGPGPELVMLHEGLGSVAMWRDFPDSLAAATGRGVLVFSRFGYGRSDPVSLPRPLSYMHHEGLTVLPKLLDACDVGDCVPVGHSDGASIAIIHAGGVRDPRVKGLALMAPHVFNEPVCVASIEKAREAWSATDLRSRLARYHGDNVDCAFRGWNEAWLYPGFLDWNIEEYLPGIAVPTLVIQGEDDEYGTLRQVEAIRDGIPGEVAVEILAACRHSPHRDSPEATLAAICALVDRVEPVREGDPR